MRRVKYTVVIMVWTQYESRCSCTASLTGVAYTKELKGLKGIALDRATLRMVEADQADTIIKAEYPGKFKG